jgi:hypothetical protein
MTLAVLWALRPLLAHVLVLEGLPASSKWPAEQRIHHVGWEGGGKVPGSRSKRESAPQL